MASTKLANFIVDARGKIAGTIYSRNGGGQYARGSFSPSNPHTQKQTQARARVRSVQSAWKKLTQVQRDAWIEAAPQFPYQNRIGDTQQLTGHALFVKLNLKIRSLNLSTAQLNTPPIPREFPAYNWAIASLINAGATMTISITRTQIFAGESGSNFRRVFFATPPLTQGASRPSESKFKQITTTTNLAGASSIGAAYVAVYGVAPVGSKIFFTVEIVHTTTGLARVSKTFYGTVV